ncbi:porin family protein [Rurimicrobium arvi]
MTNCFKYAVLSVVAACSALHAGAQARIMNMEDHDSKPYYFGLTFGLNQSRYRIQYTEAFAQHDTFMHVQPGWGTGLNLGIMGNLRLSNFVDLRLIPSISFAEKKLSYVQPGLSADVQQKSVESIYIHLPLQFKFKSDRIHNFRFYGLAGGKMDYDMAANANSRRKDEFLKFKPMDLGYELGFGLEFYYPNFIFSPEIKLSEGLMNQIYPDKSLQLTNAIDQIRTRTILISIHLEG